MKRWVLWLLLGVHLHRRPMKSIRERGNSMTFFYNLMCFLSSKISHRNFQVRKKKRKKYANSHQIAPLLLLPPVAIQEALPRVGSTEETSLQSCGCPFAALLRSSPADVRGFAIALALSRFVLCNFPRWICLMMFLLIKKDLYALSKTAGS